VSTHVCSGRRVLSAPATGSQPLTWRHMGVLTRCGYRTATQLGEPSRQTARAANWLQRCAAWPPFSVRGSPPSPRTGQSGASPSWWWGSTAPAGTARPQTTLWACTRALVSQPSIRQRRGGAGCMTQPGAPDRGGRGRAGQPVGLPGGGAVLAARVPWRGRGDAPARAGGHGARAPGARARRRGHGHGARRRWSGASERRRRAPPCA